MNKFARHLLSPRRAVARARGRVPRGARGFSLVEAMVSAGIVGVMLVASVNLLSSAARTRVADSNRRSGIMLAQQLMSEVISQPYKDEGLVSGILFGPELGELARTDFDDVDDYNNYTEKPPKDNNGVVISGFEGWTRTVKVKWVTPTTLAESLTDTGLVMIEVRVTDPRGVQTAVYALRSEHAVPAEPMPAGSTWARWTNIDLQVGTANPRHIVTASNDPARPVIK
jgi:MSHA pilin protein MshD